MRHVAPLVVAFALLAPVMLVYFRSNFFSQINNAKKNDSQYYTNAFISVLIVVFCSLFIQKTNLYLGKAPIATDDDSIANVATNLWQNNIYGFPAAPSPIHFGTSTESILKETHFDGTRDYYNYGWFYFAVGGALNWIFGNNGLHFYRMLNAWGIIFVIALGFLVFSKHSFLPITFLSIGLVGRFLSTVAPVMSRPDIAVSVTTALFFVFAYYAFRKKNLSYWVLAGFFAATASTSHPVAWTISLSAFLTWMCFSFENKENKKTIIYSLCGLCVGGFLGVFLYLYMIGFRIFDLLHFVNFLNKNVQHPNFLQQFTNGIRSAWSGSAYTYSLAIVGILLSLFFFISAFRFKNEFRNKIFSLVAAPLITLVFYILSLGVYKSLLHPKYGILVYVISFWLVGAGFTILLDIYSTLLKQKTAIFNRVIFAISAFVLLSSSFSVAKYVPMLERMSYSWINFDEFRKKALEPVVEDSFIWGSLVYGIDSGIRMNYLDLSSALAFSLHQSERGRLSSRPDFILTDYFTMQSYFINGQAKGRDNPYVLLKRHLGENEKLKQVRVTYAPPYGNTYLYKRIKNSEEDNIKTSFSYNNGISQQWITVPSKLDVKFSAEKSEPVKVDLSTHSGSYSIARETKKIYLKSGVYKLTIRLSERFQNNTSFILLTKGLYEYFESNNRLNLLPFLRGQRRAETIISHLGGDLYISFFPGMKDEKPISDSFYIESIEKIDSEHKWSSYEKIPIAYLSDWEISGDAREFMKSNGKYHIESSLIENRAFRISSPLLKLRSNTIYHLEMPVSYVNGALKLEVKNLKGVSLLYGEGSVFDGSLSFKTDSSGSVVFTLEAVNLEAAPNELKVLLGDPKLFTYLHSIDKIKDIMSCATLPSALKKERNDCTEVDDDILKKIDKELLVK
ncbi:MAG: hypothetical protein M9962_15130 [Oligoflexia bacterium]|nr:hypothetical protein [Oligoflexia bacterium]